MIQSPQSGTTTLFYKMMKNEYGVAVVGAGTAGCVVAGYLLRTTDWRIALVEAGPDYGPLLENRWPSDLLDTHGRPRSHDWGYLEELSDGRTQPRERARVVGGCSTHNQCWALWGLPADYDAWAATGNPGWSYKDIRPLIDQIERASPPSPYRGARGPIFTRRYELEELSSWQRAFVDASTASGFPVLDDVGGPHPDEGVGGAYVNVKDGVRWNSSFAFLDPERQSKNLHIFSQTLADRLVLDNGKATGLVCYSEGRQFTLNARIFVLCSGTYGSPATLMRSGIGPAHHLSDLGIPVKVDLTGVGRNLQDHPCVPVRFKVSEAAQKQLLEEMARGKLFQSQAYLKARSSLCGPGFDLHLIPMPVPDPEGQWYMEIIACNMDSRSQGFVELRATEPAEPPHIVPSYLTDEEGRDAAVLACGLRIIKDIARHDPIRSMIAGEMSHSLLGERNPDSALLEHVIRSYDHPVGTCKMGPPTDPLSVVDNNGRLRELDNVFVADASIMPIIPRANTNLTCFLIGLRVAEGMQKRNVGDR